MITIIVVIALISLAWSLISLKQILSKKELHEVKKHLSKGRVVYQSDSSVEE